MGKQIICALLCLCFLFATACGGSEAPAQSYTVDTSLKSAVTKHNETKSLSTAFVYDMRNVGAEQSLWFTQGTLNYNAEGSLKLSGRVTRIKGDSAVTSDVYYKAGAYYSDNGTGKYYTVMDSAAMLSTYFCGAIPVPEDAEITGFRRAQTSGGTKYVYSTKSYKALYLFEDCLYGYSGLRKPVKDKTVCGDSEYSYVVDASGTLKSFKISTVVTLMDTAPYYPSYSVPDAELTHSFEVSLEMNIKATGTDVKVEVPETNDYVFLG